jgi:maltooligosyltrehalose trehalohydrolase
VGNRALGDRLSAPEALRPYCALSSVLLFLPMTPLLFMGQEWAASTPFQFFTDHEAELGQKISAGRRAEFQHFQSFADPTARDRIPDPQAEETFLRSKLKWDERSTAPHADVLALHKALIALRQSDPVLRNSSRAGLTVDVRDGLLVIRRTAGQDQRVLLANLSDQPIPEALVRRNLDGGSVLLRSDLLADSSGPLQEWTALVATNRLSPPGSRAPGAR